MSGASRAGLRRAPRFSVVLPLHNGGAYLRESVGSVLAQSYGDLGLEVLENWSTDGSTEWLKSVGDPRVRVWPAPRMLPIEQNWRRTSALERGEFMLFIGHDDRLDPNYLAIVDDLIRRCPDAALFTTHHRFIDVDGQVLRPCRPVPALETMAELLAARLTYRRDMSGVGVVMRSAAYDAMGGIPAFDGLTYADDAMWLTLLDGSWKATAPYEAFSYRLHRGSVFYTQPWRSAIAAVERYADFVEALGRTRADVSQVWRTHGPASLEQRYRVVIVFAMLAGAARAGGLGMGERDEILASLDRVMPAAGRALRRRWWLRIFSWAQALRIEAPLLAGMRAYWRHRPL